MIVSLVKLRLVFRLKYTVTSLTFTNLNLACAFPAQIHSAPSGHRESLKTDSKQTYVFLLASPAQSFSVRIIELFRTKSEVTSMFSYKGNLIPFWQENINVSIAKVVKSFFISLWFLFNFVIRLPVKTTKTIPIRIKNLRIHYKNMKVLKKIEDKFNLFLWL